MTYKPVPIKIAYIGGGSKSWARGLMRDLALTPELTGQIALFDIDQKAARKNVEISRLIFGHKDAVSKFKVQAATKIEQALKGADFVVVSILPGPMTMMASDLDIPLKYGILQPVGDTTGPGGIVRALRSIPTYLEFGKKIAEHCPKAWVINYTNPMTLCTAALYRAFPEIRAIGCCHEVFGTQYELARVASAHFKTPIQNRQEIKLDIAGVNHFTFALSSQWQGHDLFPIIQKHISQKNFFADKTADALERLGKGRWFHNTHLVGYDLFRRFGVMGAAGDRHLTEFVPWYLTDERTMHRWGVVATPSSYRLGNWKPPGQESSPVSPKPVVADTLKGTGEEGVLIMKALLGLGDLDSNMNIPNTGQIPGLPLGAIVENNVLLRKNSLTPLMTGRMPDSVLSLVRRTVDVQQMTLQAGVTRDKDLAFQALLNDSRLSISMDNAYEMFNEMLQATKAMLPGWKI